MLCIKRFDAARLCLNQARNLNSRERFLKGEAVVTSKFGPLNDGPDYTVIGSHTGALPQKPALSTRKEKYEAKQWEIQEKIEESLFLMFEAKKIAKESNQDFSKI